MLEDISKASHDCSWLVEEYKHVLLRFVSGGLNIFNQYLFIYQNKYMYILNFQWPTEINCYM